MKRILTTASAALLALGTAASASTFSLVGGTAGIIPGGATNEVLIETFNLGGAAGYFGAQVELDAASDIEVAFFGYEAGFTNEFSFGGTTTTTDDLELGVNGNSQSEFAADEASPLSSYTASGIGAGLLDFSFLTDGNVPNPTVNNLLGNPDNTGTNPNFFVSFGRDSLAQSIFLFFDDGGAENDDNHDDLVVRLTIGSGQTEPNPVPLPATGLLLLGALGGMRMMKRRS
ncbi:MAG: hypothetical protein ABJM43_24005 [Paracoccaceae bacterium]|uniref:hypothetical protein n=1 Tax=Shimia thalassica TaxID=1715693 RepID=UPI00329805CC